MSDDEIWKLVVVSNVSLNKNLQQMSVYVLITYRGEWKFEKDNSNCSKENKYNILNREFCIWSTGGLQPYTHFIPGRSKGEH